MKKAIICILLILLIPLIAACSNQSQEKIGVLDMEKILSSSQRAEKLQQELLDIGNRLEVEYNQKKENLSGEQEEEELDRVYSEYMNNKERLEKQLNQEVDQILVKIVEEKKLDVIVKKGDIYYGGLDITGEVIEELDKELTEGGAGNNG